MIRRSLTTSTMCSHCGSPLDYHSLDGLRACLEKLVQESHEKIERLDAEAGR